MSDSRRSLPVQSTPPIMEATWLGFTAHAHLRPGERGVVDGVFDGAINIRLARGLVCLVTEAIGRGPLNATLRLPARSTKVSSLGARAGDAVRVRGSALEFGEHCRVEFGSAEIYSPGRKFTEPMIEDDEIASNLGVARKTALVFGKTGGLGELLALLRPGVGGMEPTKLNIFASSAVQPAADLDRAFRSGDRFLMTDAVRRLIGLGPGLTPSSDDMLAGLALVCVLFAENTGNAQGAANLVGQAIAAEATTGRTTRLSQEYLKEAALGRGNEPVMRLCAALLTGTRGSVERETRRVLAIGETSGTDIVLGLVFGTMLCTGRPSGLSRGGLE